jgi:drug/metabolite transporter (DMT)-like permease
VGARLAVPAFIFIWASGFVVAKLAATDAEALSFLLLRYTGVTVLMTMLALAAGARWPRGHELWHVAWVGVLLQATYLGGVWVAIRAGMPAGLAALIVNLQPVLTLCLTAWWGERVTRRQTLGVLVGFVGVVIVLWSKLAAVRLGEPEAAGILGPLALCVLALVAATLAVLYQKKHVSEVDARSSQAVQFAASFMVTLPFAWAFESFDVRFTPDVVIALLWSIFVLSGMGMSLMLYLIRTGSVTRLTSSMYLVPGITALMAWVLFDERLSWNIALGMAVTLAGLYLVVRAPARP